MDTVTRRLNLGPYVVVGNSMGGGVAWTLALTRPERLRGLVLVDSVSWPSAAADGGSSLLYKALASPAGLWALKNLDTRWYARSNLRAAYVTPSLVTPALIDRYVDLSRGPGHRTILLNIGPSAGPPVTAATLEAIKTPTLVMQGEADRSSPWRWGGRWRRLYRVRNWRPTLGSDTCRWSRFPTARRETSRIPANG